MKIICRAGCAGEEEEECLNILKMIPPLVCFFVTLCHISITPTMRRRIHAVAVRSGRHSSDGSFWGSSGWLAAAIAGRHCKTVFQLKLDDMMMMMKVRQQLHLFLLLSSYHHPVETFYRLLHWMQLQFVWAKNKYKITLALLLLVIWSLEKTIRFDRMMAIK